MSVTSKGTKNLFLVILLIGAAAAGFGYLRQSSDMRETSEANATTPGATTDAIPPRPQIPPQAKSAPPSDPIFGVRTDDIVIGKTTAPVTIVEYASLSCPHCAHFYEDVLPQVRKEFLDTGKAKLVYRHFPLNEPALRAAQLVECADKDQKENFIKVLYDMQRQWAYNQDFVANLKQIALVGGVDAARFDSCMADKKLENRILASRQEAAKTALVGSTPTIFVSGLPIQGEVTIEAVRAAIKGGKAAPAATAEKPAEPEATK